MNPVLDETPTALAADPETCSLENYLALPDHTMDARIAAARRAGGRDAHQIAFVGQKRGQFSGLGLIDALRQCLDGTCPCNGGTIEVRRIIRQSLDGRRRCGTNGSQRAGGWTTDVTYRIIQGANQFRDGGRGV